MTAATGDAPTARNLQTVYHLLQALASDRDPVETGWSLASIASDWQAATLRLEPLRPGGTAPRFDPPSSAFLTLAARWNADVSLSTVQRLRALDGLPSPVAVSLSKVGFAFLTFDETSQAALSGFDGTSAGTAMHAKLGPVLEARQAFLGSAVGFRRAVAEFPFPTAFGAGPIVVPPAFALDLTGRDDVYKDGVALSIDLGGNDTYLNNAGGTNVLGKPRFCAFTEDPRPGAAALVDLSGNDHYGAPTSVHHCGANGGGMIGAGFLLDAAGDDVYAGGQAATNGGGNVGVGFLLDAAGNDTYTALADGVNGGAEAGGLGMLIDVVGDDVYAPGMDPDGLLGPNQLGCCGSNGGALAAATGFLLDGDGDDGYAGASSGANGGGAQGTGFLLDAAGDDRYTAADGSTNGGAVLGFGFLFDATGQDLYVATSRGTNGGGLLGGVGRLFDVAGDDTYWGGDLGANGAAGTSCVSVIVLCAEEPVAGGLLWDGGGSDRYADNEPGSANGSGMDRTVVPKGMVGAQVDVAEPPS